MAASTHASGVPSGAGAIVRTAIRQVIPPEPEYPVRRAAEAGDAGGRRTGGRKLPLT